MSGGTTLTVSEALQMALEGSRVNEVTPPRVQALSRESHATATPPRVWSLSQLDEVFHELLSAQQLVLHFQFYEWDEQFGWTRSESPWSQGPWELDFELSWPELVQAATEQALEAARFANLPSNAIAALTWIDRTALDAL